MTHRDVALIIGAVILIVLLFGLLGGGMMMGWAGMGPWMMGYGYGFNPLGWIMMLVVWAVVIGLIVLLATWLFRQTAPSLNPPTSRARALDILKERYARGELSREQYEEMKREIEGSE